MKGKTKAIITVFVVILAGIYYYAAIPAINIHSSETWFFIMIFLVIRSVTLPGAEKGILFYLKPDFGKMFAGGLSGFGDAVYAAMGMDCKGGNRV